MSHADSNALMVAPTLSEAVGAVFTEEERDTLKDNLRTEQVAQAKYLRAHPEIRAALQEGLRRVLQEQPEDPVAVLTQFYMSDEFVNYQIGSAPPA